MSLQSCSPAQAMTTPASDMSQTSPQRRLHSPATPFLDVSCLPFLSPSSSTYLCSAMLRKGDDSMLCGTSDAIIRRMVACEDRG